MQKFPIPFFLITFVLLFNGCFFYSNNEPNRIQYSNGLEYLTATDFAILEGKRFGLVANTASVDDDGRNIFEHIQSKRSLNCKIIFTPEHGFDLTSAAGESVENSEIDGLEIFSLYGQTRRIPTEKVQDLDLLIFDLQSVGSRYFTYISTLKYSMDVCANSNTDLLILDRPNPIGIGIVQGPILEEDFESFVGALAIPTRHGLTIGEIGIYLRATVFPNVKLDVIPEKHLFSTKFDEKSDFVRPSPNIRSLEAAIMYSGACLIEGTNLSEGRGTEIPFLQIGAPWFDSEKIIHNLPREYGINFNKCTFLPAACREAPNPKFVNQLCEGLRFHVESKNANPIRFVVELLQIIERNFPDDFKFHKNFFDKLAGNSSLRKAIGSKETVKILFEEWEKTHEQYLRRLHSASIQFIQHN